MTVHMEMTHGNESVVHRDFDTMDEALRVAEQLENAHHGNVARLERRFGFRSETDTCLQLGTGYHWMTFKQVDDDDGADDRGDRG